MTDIQDRPRNSVVEIEYSDGSTDEFAITASPAIIKSLVMEASKTGFFRLWNDKDGMLVRADGIRSIFVRYE